MEAAQPGQPGQEDQVAALGAKLDGLQKAIADVQTRVSSDLSALKDQVQQLQDSTPPEVDLTAVITRIDELVVTVESIDPVAAAAGVPPEQPPGDGSPPTDVPADQPADAGVSPDPAAGDAPADTGAATGEQGTDAWTEGGQAPSQ